jgi:hypothetical protein
MTKAVETQLKNAFGFVPAESAHHFVVLVPRGAADPIVISEHYTWDDAAGSGEASLSARGDGQIRVFLPRPKWDAIAGEVRAQFNQRLKRQGHKPGSWQTGPNLLRRDLGKELVLLAWAIEEADPALISAAVANWNGLEPEERWWLYTMTAASTGHATNDRGTGWRKAVRYALTENPVTAHAATEARIPEFFARAAGPLFGGPRWDDLPEPEATTNEE